jgi:hypothetical protein
VNCRRLPQTPVELVERDGTDAGVTLDPLVKFDSAGAEAVLGAVTGGRQRVADAGAAAVDTLEGPGRSS